jgi:hypothetical protein
MTTRDGHLIIIIHQLKMVLFFLLRFFFSVLIQTCALDDNNTANTILYNSKEIF